MGTKKKKSKVFPVFLAAYSSILIVLIVFGLTWVWWLLSDYEDGLAEVNAEKALVNFSAGKISGTLSRAGVSAVEFESFDVLCKTYENFLEGKEISYKRNSSEYTSSNPAYYVLAGEDVFASFKLNQNGVNRHGFPVWEIGDITFMEDIVSRENVTVKVPSGVKVMINGIYAEPEKYMTRTEVPELAENISEYVEYVPAYDIYTIEGLIESPSVEAEGDNIASMTVSGNEIFFDYASDEELLNENEELIKRIGTNYGGYIINRVSFRTLAADLIGSAKKYMSDIPAIWAYLYGEEYTYDFTDWNITDVKKYSDECFSCRLEFVLNVHYRVTRTVNYDTKLECMFIKKDGRWYMADFIMN